MTTKAELEAQLHKTRDACSGQALVEFDRFLAMLENFLHQAVPPQPPQDTPPQETRAGLRVVR